MIPKMRLKSIAVKRLVDAKVLLNNKRYFASVYIAGYCLELVLKYRIAKIMQFNKGFPENKTEFNSYYLDTRKVLLHNTIRELRDIRNHDLSKLLHYSGEEVKVLSRLNVEWEDVKNWSPEMRYSDFNIKKQKAVIFLKSVRVILNELL